jgi:hypothetical protein
MSIRVPHAHMTESMESISASSLSLFVSFSISFFPLLQPSSRIDVLFPSIGIYSIAVANRLQSSPSIFWTVLTPIPESRSVDFSHSYERLICAYEGVNGVNLSFVASVFVSLFP